MNQNIRYHVMASADEIISTHSTVSPAIASYESIGNITDKALGFTNDTRAGLLMARDVTGRDVTMRHELPGRDLAVPEISLALDLVERQVLAKDPNQDLTDPMIGDGVPFERIRRITGYLVGSLDRFNNAKRAEVADRVTHGMSSGTTMAERIEDATSEAHRRAAVLGKDDSDRENRG